MARMRPPIPRVLLDINILLDVLLARQPWNSDATMLLDAVSRGICEGFVAGHSITTVHYLIQSEVGRQRATTVISELLTTVQVVGLEREDFFVALTLGLTDFEDAVQVAAALKIGADFIATRNARDFKGTAIPVRSAGEIIAFLRATKAIAP